MRAILIEYKLGAIRRISTRTQEADSEKFVQLTHDYNGGNLRYVARADGVADSIVVIIIVAIYVIIVILRHDGGRAAVVTDLIQIAHAHGGSDARRHRRHILRDGERERHTHIRKIDIDRVRAESATV